MDYDIIVIGGGPGSTRAAKILADNGKKVALVCKELGGECLNYGCIPTKAYLWLAELLEKVALANRCGIEVSDARINWEKMKEHKKKIVDKLQRNLKSDLERSGVTIINGIGELTDANTVKISNGTSEKIISAKYLILATGGESIFPPGFSQNGNISNNHDLLNLPQIPKSLLVVGGGAIGVEFATIFAALGTSVTIAEKSPNLLSREDPEIGTELERIFVRKGIQVLKNTVIAFEQTLEYEKTLIAIGRRPYFKSLSLDSAGVKYGKTGIFTNDFMQTNIPHIFAVGDVAGKSLLAYTADREGEIAAQFILGNKPKPLQYEGVPNTIFCIPEVASVGLSEKEAREKNIDFVTGKGLFSANSKALILSSRDGFVKIVAEKQNHRVLGVHIIGEKASELIAEATLAVNSRLTLEDLYQSIHSHPVLGEVIKDAIDRCLENI